MWDSQLSTINHNALFLLLKLQVQLLKTIDTVLCYKKNAMTKQIKLNMKSSVYVKMNTWKSFAFTS